LPLAYDVLSDELFSVNRDRYETGESLIGGKGAATAANKTQAGVSKAPSIEGTVPEVVMMEAPAE
jgi:hypothetical protein